jgi:hypothetical protein
MKQPSSPIRWASKVTALLGSLGALLELATKAVKLWRSFHQ